MDAGRNILALELEGESKPSQGKGVNETDHGVSGWSEGRPSCNIKLKGKEKERMNSNPVLKKRGRKEDDRDIDRRGLGTRCGIPSSSYMQSQLHVTEPNKLNQKPGPFCLPVSEPQQPTKKSLPCASVAAGNLDAKRSEERPWAALPFCISLGFEIAVAR